MRTKPQTDLCVFLKEDPVTRVKDTRPWTGGIPWFCACVFTYACEVLRAFLSYVLYRDEKRAFATKSCLKKASMNPRCKFRHYFRSTSPIHNFYSLPTKSKNRHSFNPATPSKHSSIVLTQNNRLVFLVNGLTSRGFGRTIRCTSVRGLAPRTGSRSAS